MLSSPVYAKLQPRTDPPPARTRHTPNFPFSIHPLCFQTLPHSFAQWTTPISFSFNRFHALSIVMGGGGYLNSKNLNHPFNSRPSPRAPSFHQNHPRLFVSITYKLPTFYPLCFDIHPCNGGVGGGSTNKSLKKNLNYFRISMETRNKRLFSRSNDRRFWTKAKRKHTAGLARTTGSSSMIPWGRNQEACWQWRSRTQ
jgi:hypothetical protein